MKCPFCNYYDTGVIESRQIDNEKVVKRRRICKKCNKRFTTYERIDLIPLMVIKKDKRREIFSKDKIISGILKACEKRPISVEIIKNITNDLEENISIKGIKEIKSSEIGELIMNRLKELDEVAYVRFASVYRQFKDLSSFIQEIKKLNQ